MRRRRAVSSRTSLLLAVSIAAVLASGLVAVTTVSRGADRCPTTTLHVAADPNALDWVRDLTIRYNQGVHRVDGRCVTVSLTLMDRDRAAAALQPAPYPGAGTPPDVWIPDSTSLVQLLRSRPGAAQVLPAAPPSVASSPLVVAAPADVVQALAARPGGPPSLATLLGLARDPAGWGAIGHPEWGRLRLSFADPAASMVSTNFLVGLAGQVHGVTPAAVTPATFSDPKVQAALVAFERVAALRPASTSDLLDQVATLDDSASEMRSVGLMILSEQDVWQYDGTAPTVPLRAMYPFGGALADDYPFVVPNGTWVTQRARDAARALREWLSGPQARAALATFGMRGSDGSVGPLATGDRGIAADTFTPKAATDPTTAPTAQGAWRLVTRRGSTLAVIDVSGSMGTQVPGTGATRLELAVEGAVNALPLYSVEDHLGLWEFSTDLPGGADFRQLVPLGPVSGRVGGRDRRVAMADAYHAMTPQRGTALYDTTLAAFEYAQKNYLPDAINVVVLLTDGQNEDPASIGLDDLLRELRQRQNPAHPVRILTIAYGAQASGDTLRRIAKATGGLSFDSVDPRDIGRVFLNALAAFGH